MEKEKIIVTQTVTGHIHIKLHRKIFFLNFRHACVSYDGIICFTLYLYTYIQHIQNASYLLYSLKQYKPNFIACTGTMWASEIRLSLTDAGL